MAMMIRYEWMDGMMVYCLAGRERGFLGGEKGVGWRSLGWE